MSIIEGYPQVGVERFELPTPCSQSMGQLIVLLLMRLANYSECPVKRVLLK